MKNKQIYSWLGAVLPNYRRRGIARRLMQIQIKLAKSLGYKKITVKTHNGHPEMISFLEKENFRRTKIEKDHWAPGKDASFYEKSI